MITACFPDKIFSTFRVKSNLRFALDLMTDFIIDKLVLNLSAVTVMAFVSFGKQDPWPSRAWRRIACRQIPCPWRG